MFTVLNSYKSDDGVVYAIKDFSDAVSEIEVVTEEELKLLASVGVDMKTVSGELVSISGDILTCNVEDITDKLGQDDFEDDDYFSDYEDYDEDDSLEDGLDDYDLYDEDDSDDEFNFEDNEDDDFFADFEEDDDPEGSVVSKLYALLNEDQIKILKRYYLWYSQRIFTDAQKDPTFGFKNKKRLIQKKSALSNLRGSGEWRYAGFLDTGSRMAGYTCSLGHPLRYLQLAWDITIGDIETCFFGENYNVDFEDIIKSNNCIVFGIKCIGDFFEVDKDCIQSLQRTQRDSLKDMALLYDIYANEDVQKVSESFNLLDNIIKKVNKIDVKGNMLKEGYVPMVSLGAQTLYLQFREVGLIPPKSLIQEIRSNLVGWTDGKHYFNNKWTGELRYPTIEFRDKLKRLISKPYREYVDNLNLRTFNITYVSTIEDTLKMFVDVMFMYEICGIYKYDAETQKDEGGKSKPVKADLANRYRGSGTEFFTDYEYSLETIEKLFKLCVDLKPFGFSMSNFFEVDYPVKDSETETSRGSLLDRYTYEITRMLEQYKQESGVDFRELCDTIRRLAGMFEYAFRRSYRMNTSRLSDLLTFVDNKTSFVEYYNKVTDLVARINDTYENIVVWSESYKQKCFEDVKAKRLAEEESERLKAEEIRLQVEKEKAKQEESKSINTPQKVVEYLQNQDLSGLSSAWDLPKNILETVKKSGKEPSDRQFYHISRLYKEVSGCDYSGVGFTKDKVELSSRQDLVEAIDFIMQNIDLASNCASEVKSKYSVSAEKLLGVLESIKKYGKISEKQMPYAEAALKVFKERTDDN